MGQAAARLVRQGLDGGCVAATEAVWCMAADAFGEHVLPRLRHGATPTGFLCSPVPCFPQHEGTQSIF